MPTARLLTPIDARDVGDGRTFDLLATLKIDVGELLDFDHGPFDGFEAQDGRTIVTVPAGFRTDFSSIPLRAQAFVMGPKDRYRGAGAGHDWGYYVGIPREPADRMWWIIARSGPPRVDPVRAYAGWAVLRALGWRAYRQHAARREARA